MPPGITVLERGWLSANNVVLTGPDGTAVVDTGYWSHSRQTVALVRQALARQSLDLILNTHLHSDHCGGNAALKEEYPSALVLIPPGQSNHVRDWDPVALSYGPTGQFCPPFSFQGLLIPGQEVLLGGLSWQIHAAPGHDIHSIILFEPNSKILISADALWQNGFGVVFQELEGTEAFNEVAATLDIIQSLDPLIVIPGHGKPFSNPKDALAAARRRLENFVRDPIRHAKHAIKVLLKFKLLELQHLPLLEFETWALCTPYVQIVHSRYFAQYDSAWWIRSITQDLVASGAARTDGDQLINI